MTDFSTPPFRYPGSQVYALGALLPLMPRHRTYIEPFCGGASTFFAKDKAKENWLNDIDPELIEVYRAIRDRPEKLVEFIAAQEDSIETYNQFRDWRPTEGFDIATRWFYLNLTSSLEKMSLLWQRDEQARLRAPGWGKRIIECSTKLQGAQLTSEDFEKVIASAPESAFLFMSPPYSIHHKPAQVNLHKHPFQREDHYRLRDALKQRKSTVNFMVTYNENEELREMYSWDKNITIIQLNNRPPLKKEIIIINYNPNQK